MLNLAKHSITIRRDATHAQVIREWTGEGRKAAAPRLSVKPFNPRQALAAAQGRKAAKFWSL